MKYIYQEILKENGQALRGVINTPNDFDPNMKYKSVIFFHGLSGDRNGSKWFRISNADYLCDLGYVVVRFDFSGTGESDGDFYDMTLTREISEARLIVDFVKNLSYIDKDEISWYGHSLGGVIASLLAYELKPKSLLLLAPASDITKADFLINQEMELKNVMDASIDYRNEDNRKNLLEILPIEDYDFGGVKIHKNFFVDLLQYDTYEKAKKYGGRVLIIRGALDDLVDRKSNEKLKESFEDSIYIEIENTDHSFTNQDARLEIYEEMKKFLSAK